MNGPHAMKMSENVQAVNRTTETGIKYSKCRKCLTNYISKPYKWCNKCMSEYCMEWRKKNRIYDLERKKEYRKNHKTNYKELKYKNHQKIKARETIRHKVQSGKIKKPLSCEICGSNELLHGHHEDYLDILNVKWVCYSCHGKIHRKH